MHFLFDLARLPRSSFLGQNLNLFGRLTFGWLWTDDPEVARVHQEQDTREGGD
jgi:hypothetical protein